VFLGAGATRGAALAWISFDLALFCGAIAVFRGDAPTRASTLAYRTTACVPVLATFAQLHIILPAAHLFPIVFVGSQIIVATMYLRWHYLIDVLAGLSLAASVFVFSTRALDDPRHDRGARRRRGGKRPEDLPTVGLRCG